MANINEKVYIGSVDTPTLFFDQRNIEDIVCNNSVDLIGDELSSDVLEVSVFFDDADEVLRNTAYGTPIFYYSNDYLVGKYYVSEIERKGLKRYLIQATSLIGLIAKEDFYGGFYTGEQFDKVVSDILFTNGVSLTKYYVYKPTPASQYTTAVKLSQNEINTNYPKYRVHLDFVFNGEHKTGSAGGYISNLFGYSSGSNPRHYIAITAMGISSGTPYCSVSVYYGNSSRQFPSSSTDPRCGIGSRFEIDVDPISGIASIKVDRVDPSDASIREHQEITWSITPFTASTSRDYNYAYGGTYYRSSTYPNEASTCSAKVIWNAYQVYDENGNMFIDAMFATNEDDTKRYVANTVSNYIVETTSFDKYGDCVGIISDFSRYERDIELMNSLIYGEGVATLPIRGWIDYGTRREALHKLIFAENVCLLKTDEGKILFTKISEAVSNSIPNELMFDDSKEKVINGAKKINVTEHSFETGTDSKVIFDNSSSVAIEGQYVVLFDNAPIYGTPTASGITIINYNCNAAVVTGRGTITGTPYIHSKNVIEYTNNNSSDGSDVSVKDIGLITSFNSDNIMNKLKSYYSGSLKKITNSLVYSGEKCGVKYRFSSLYNNLNEAFLTKLSAKSSSFVKALCEFVSGYKSPELGGYSSFMIGIYGETWEVPQEIRSKEYPNIRLNIIGKGHDGTAGSNGQPGNRGQYGEGALQGGTGGEGGDAGVGGDGGNVYVVTIDVNNVNHIDISGSGYNTIIKTYNDSGTLLNTYNSSSGTPSDTGFMNVFTGIYYARKGKDGFKGGSGGQGGYITFGQSGVKKIKGESGGSVDSYAGGESFECIVKAASSVSGTYYEYNSYGGGGGAAYGSNGGNASIARQPFPEIVETNGGNGANASVPDNVYTEYGSGGFGGNGGGGGGGAGTRTTETESGYYTYYYWSGGYGTGSSGTPGIDGCVIIYY